MPLRLNDAFLCSFAMAARGGLTSFMAIGFGQLLSLASTAMANLALSVWAWQETGAATTLALMIFFSFTPQVMLSPIAGDLIDRWPKKVTMILSDFGAAISTAVVLLLLSTGHLEIWHLYLLALWSGAFSSFQEPAFAAAIPNLVNEAHLGRANAVLGLAHSGANVIAPILAGALLAIIGIRGVLILDIIAVCIAIGILLSVRVPDRRSNGAPAPSKYWRRISLGFTYIGRRPELRLLLGLYAFVNALGAVGMVLLAPLVLARSGGSAEALGHVLAATGAGGIIGGTLVGAFGVPRKRIHGVLFALAALSVLGYGLTAFADTPLGWLAGAFCITFFVPLLNSSHQTIWQTSVPHDVMGRVFAARRAIGQATMPVVMLGMGPLADYITNNVPLWDVFGSSESGIAFIFFVSSVVGLLVALIGFVVPKVRSIESRLAN